MANQVTIKQATAPATVAKKQSFSTFMTTTGNKLVNNVLTDHKRNSQFVANLCAAVSANPTLQECNYATVVSAALQAEALHFPINNALGYVYLVPFNKSEYNPTTHKREIVDKLAQFQIGYKGYIQLAIRSGQYKSINAVEVKEGELGSYDPLNGQTFNWNPNYEERKKLKVIGYVGQFELINGFKTQYYMTFDEMLDHADTYSQAFKKEYYLKLQAGEPILDENGKDMSWKLSSFWYKNFDEMAKKTILRRMLSKFGVMSVEMTEALIKDQAEIKPEGGYEYIDAKQAYDAEESAKEETMGSVPFDEETGEVQEQVEEPKSASKKKTAKTASPKEPEQKSISDYQELSEDQEDPFNFSI